MVFWDEYIEKNKEFLDVIYPHTEYKVKYVSTYVSEWLKVAINYPATKNINFIDCMCNAGIYREGQLGTTTEVLKIFCEAALKNSHIQFNLFVNDIDAKRIEIIKYVFENVTGYTSIENVNVIYNNSDVNEYLDTLLTKENYFSYDAKAFTILFVDPYRFGDVVIKKLNNFFVKYYAELIFNYFSSDYRRNIKNDSAKNHKEAMINSMNGIKGYSEEMSAEQVLEIIQGNFIGETRLKYTFAYPFHISSNVQLYYIIYGTPSIKGIEKIKDCIWNVFNGSSRHRTNPRPNQVSMFSVDEEKKINIQTYLNKDVEKILQKFKGKKVTFKEINEYVLLNTMLKTSQIIEGVLKPLISQNKLIKENIKGKRNYKEDMYYFVED